MSFRDRSVAAIAYEVEATEAPMRAALQSNLVANESDRLPGEDPRAGRSLGTVLVPRLAVDDGMRVVLAHSTRHTALSLAAGMEHMLDAPREVKTLVQTEPDLGRLTVSAHSSPGALRGS